MNILDFITLINQLLNRRTSTKIRKLKQIFLHGYCSINLLNYNERQPTSEFLNCLSCKSIISYVLQPRSLIGHSKTLTDNFFFQMYLHVKQYPETLLEPYLIIYPSFCFSQCDFKSFIQKIKLYGQRLVAI